MRARLEGTGHAHLPVMQTFLGLTVVLLVAFSPHARADALSKSCKSGDPFSCLEGAPSLPGAMKACELGEAKGCMVSAGLLLNGKAAKPAQALTYFEKACELGDSLGCYESGKLLSKVDVRIRESQSKLGCN